MVDNANTAATKWSRCEFCREPISLRLNEETGREVWASGREVDEGLEPFCHIHWERGKEPHKPQVEGFINDFADLCDHFGADEPRLLNHRIYKDTACGASISLYFGEEEPLHNGLERERWNVLTLWDDVIGFTIQTIVEGSEATVNSDLFKFPVTTKTVDDWMEYMEAEADALWREANEDPELIDGFVE